MHNRHFAYRPDVDGLRAIAVTTVVISHAFPGTVPGGVVGVDIFFVISGFLITGILQLEIANSTFSIWKFYARRIRRLFPALALVLAATLAVGWMYLLEDEYRKLGWHVSAGAGFFSNIALWAESGYFDTESALKPLLHLWSLGVEEQFYFVWPLVLVIAAKTRSRIFLVAGLLSLISFIANVVMVKADPVGAFFLPFPRFWELMLGGLLAAAAFSFCRHRQVAPLLPSHRRMMAALSEVAALLGVIMIGASVAILDPKKDFPGWWMLPTIVGSLLVIGSGRQTLIARHLLSHPALVYIGLISYPLYLWHWPLLSFANTIYAQTPPFEVRVGLTVVAFLLAVATYTYVELPLRMRAMKLGHSSPVMAGLGATMLAMCLAGLMVHQGVPSERLHELSSTLGEAKRDWEYPGDEKATLKGTLGGSVLFFGDSYVQQLYPRIKYLAGQSWPHRTAIFHTSAGCAPIPDIARKSDSRCAAYAKQGFKLAEAPEVKTVVIGGSWLGMIGRGDYYELTDPDARIIDFKDDAALNKVLERLESKLAGIQSMGKRVFLVLNPPGGRQADPGTLERPRWGTGKQLEVKFIPMSEHLLRTGNINTRIRSVAERVGIDVIDPAEWICVDGKCYFTDSLGYPRFRDSTHFRASFVSCCVTAFDRLIAPNSSLLKGQQLDHSSIENMK